ncbi:DUF192 domain-containing protein [Ectothiorhodospiraceae bacterium WFHF3C12]|nr:DUF192 domain-containing protein [Ectothiorhodospiraceae bacterium WFHF3C12]
MVRTSCILAVLVLLACAGGAGAAGLADLPVGRVLVDGEAHAAHIADDSRERGQGFQHVPADRIREAMIYFHFPRPVVPRFHMRNVAAPLAIAWIDADGRVIGIDIMEPGGSGYVPPGPITAALELHPARLDALGLDVGSRVRVQPGE